MQKPVFLIDGYSLIYRYHFVFIKNPLRNLRGENTSAIYGFFRSLFQLINKYSPTHLAIVLDSLTPTFRKEMYTEYKSNREQAPEELHAQMPRIETLLRALGIPNLRVNGYEADDLIATIARMCRQEATPCYILSGDKDLLQLVNDQVKILYPGKNTNQTLEEWGREEVFTYRSVYPEQIVDYLSMTGDASDNVPGVPGIGDKTAVKLLHDYGTLDKIYASLNSLSSASQRQKLQDGKESAYMSRELILLKDDVPLETYLPHGLASLHVQAPEIEEAKKLFHLENIKTFDKELTTDHLIKVGLQVTTPLEEAETSAGNEPTLAAIVNSGAKGEESPAPGETSLAETGVAGPATADGLFILDEVKHGMYTCVQTEAELDKWIRKVKEKKIFAFDTETDDVDEMNARLVGCSIAVGKGEACYIPIRAVGHTCLKEELVLSRLSEILTDPWLKLIGQNIKFDYKVLKHAGITIRNVYFDTMVAAWVLEATNMTFNMDKLAHDYLGYKCIAYTDLIKKSDKLTLADIDLGLVTDYAGEDADIAYRLYQVFSQKLKNQQLEDLFYQLEMPNVCVLAEMELTGILLNTKILKSFSRELEQALRELEKEIYKEAKREFNINSTQQLQEILFTERGLPPQKKTKTGYSTDYEVLQALAPLDPVCALVLEHRTLAKLKSTYVDALPLLVHPATGRLHTHYIQTGTTTGRLSSKNPNLQNIPIKDEYGRQIREAFIAPEGSWLLSADYSQIELVILANLAKDHNLMNAFAQGKDIHTQTASILFGVEEDKVTPDQRRVGKTINFGVIYGMSGFRLSRELGIPKALAETFIKTYFQRFSGVEAFIKETISKAEVLGYVTTIRGRQRKVPLINSRNKTQKSGEERVAVNTPIQGPAADIVKLAMLRVSETLRTRKLASRLILQVHDELILEVPEAELKEVLQLVKKEMERAVELPVPLRVNLAYGKSWGSLQ
jgi:DNA polymerase-1